MNKAFCQTYDLEKMSEVRVDVDHENPDESHMIINYIKSQHSGYENLIAISDEVIFNPHMFFLQFVNGKFIMPGYEFAIEDYCPSLKVFVLRRIFS